MNDLLKQALDALKDIRQMSNADDPASYRADDREGCLDTVFATSDSAIAAIEAAQAQPEVCKFCAVSDSLVQEYRAQCIANAHEIQALKAAQPVGVPAGMPACEFVKAPMGNYPQLIWVDGYKAKIGDKFYLAAAPSLPVDEKVQPCKQAHPDEFTCPYCCDGTMDYIVPSARQAAKVELPVVAIVEDWPDDRQPLGIVRRVQWSELPEGTKLVRLSDALAAQGEKP